MVDEALNEILNLSSTATMALVSIGMIYATIIYAIASLLSIFTRWMYKKMDEHKKERADHV